MTKKELTILAARACNLSSEYIWRDDPEWMYAASIGRGRTWAPVDNETDAFLLACELKISVGHEDFGVTAIIRDGYSFFTPLDHHNGSRVKAACYAIARVAAQIATLAAAAKTEFHTN